MNRLIQGLNHYKTLITQNLADHKKREDWKWKKKGETVQVGDEVIEWKDILKEYKKTCKGK